MSQIPAPCRACDARLHGICGALDATQQTVLARSSTRRSLSPGSALINEAQPVDRYAVILSGAVKLTKSLSDGREQIVGLQFSPDFLGRPFQEESIVTAQTATAVVLCSFPRKTFESLIMQSLLLENRLLRQTLSELDASRSWMLTLGRKTAQEKVASYLLLIAERCCVDGVQGSEPLSFDLPMSRLEIADYLGLTIETVSRQLSKLRAEGIIALRQSRHLQLIDPVRLKVRSGT
ncbi:Crp/Fnr family transcriptional regulator [Rhizobium sp. Leaf341]|uniref:Crp/Fnr family transcriptional regulator n=1 Tax=Rhizobium sp. Leaf341 TaxID=1736344 RepID=UPI000712394D|nr:Crp/Fnr family transcriptional regulator [Rhizobium sp. Leaf341]KQR69387.1 transcriptional regulator [Rhizobium sp. Leaf341]